MNRPSAARRAIAAIVISGVSLAGCAADSPSPTASSTPAAIPSASVLPSVNASAAPSSQPTAAETTGPSVEPTGSQVPFACVPSVTIAKTTARAQITDVRVGTHVGYDRVTFQFSAGIPQTVVEGVLPPFYADPSALPVDVAGTAFLRVTMNGGTSVAPDGGTTYGGPTDFQPGYPQLAQLIQGGDFEASAPGMSASRREPATAF